jgi:hypothetical protein
MERNIYTFYSKLEELGSLFAYPNNCGISITCIVRYVRLTGIMTELVLLYEHIWLILSLLKRLTCSVWKRGGIKGITQGKRKTKRKKEREKRKTTHRARRGKGVS